MSSTLQKEFENKLLVALTDARVAVIANKEFLNEESTLEMADEYVHAAMDAYRDGDLKRQHRATLKAIALLLNYQVNFL